MKKQLLFLFMLGLMFTFSSCSDDDSPAAPVEGYTTAEKYLEEVGFSGSVLVRKGDADVIRQGYGLANKTGDVPNDPSLIYRIGSVTKSFTAAAIVNLQRDGLIENLDQPLSDFDDEFPMGDQITIRHLLTHHSGIRDYVGPVEDYAEANNYFFDTEEILDVIVESIEEDGLIFTPGEFFAYSNSNYMILGVLIEALTGTSYEDYLEEKVYTPLGLSKTNKGPDIISGSGRAQGYFQGSNIDSYQMQIAFSAGELESTLSDLEKWGDAMMGNYYSEAEKQVVFADPIGQDGVNTVGAGWFTLTIENQVVYHHGGDIDGFTSLLVLLPESNGLIILLSNEQDKGDQRNQIMETLIKNEF